MVPRFLNSLSSFVSWFLCNPVQCFLYSSGPGSWISGSSASSFFVTRFDCLYFFGSKFLISLVHPFPVSRIYRPRFFISRFLSFAVPQFPVPHSTGSSHHKFLSPRFPAPRLLRPNTCQSQRHFLPSSWAWGRVGWAVARRHRHLVQGAGESREGRGRGVTGRVRKLREITRLCNNLSQVFLSQFPSLWLIASSMLIIIFLNLWKYCKKYYHH